VIVPYGFLHAVPFHALLGPDGPLIVDREVTLRPAVAVRPRPKGAGAPLLVGVPDGVAPHIETEIAGIRRALPAGRTLLGSDATVAAFKRRAPRAGILHIATHGVFRDDNPSFSALRLADGWLGMGEIGGLGLRADLVTLSACETGRAQVLTGDEVAGLAREFLAAGVPTLHASLWRVNDRSTAEYMNEFYADLRAGAAPASAMRTAALAVRSRYRHPYHWAAFAVLGDGRSAVDSSPWEIGEERRCGVHQE
jgi:CHAT domain-containing protein